MQSVTDCNASNAVSFDNLEYGQSLKLCKSNKVRQHKPAAASMAALIAADCLLLISLCPILYWLVHSVLD